MIIKNGYVVTMDEEKKVYRDGAVVFREDCIVEVGKTSDVLQNNSDDEVIDAKGKMVLPGFVNTHNHLYQTIMRGLGDDGEGMRPKGYRWDIDLLRGLDKEACYASGVMSMVEMIRSGITCTQDSHYINFHGDSIDGIAESARNAGLRLVLGRGSWDLHGLAPEELTEDIDTAIKESRKVSKKWHDGDMTKVIYEASLLSQVSDELILETKQAAREDGLGWGMHIQGPLASHKDDPRTGNESLRRYGGRAMEYLNSIGVLGPDSLLVHCTFTTNREIPILAQTGTPVAHCPCANAWAGRSIVTPVPSMLDMGVTVGLGTDGAMTNNSLDMMHAMNFATLINKVNYGTTKAMTAERILNMSTRLAAKALCIDEKIGSLEKGKKADIVLVDMKAPGMAPALLPVKNLVFSATSTCVDTVIINGKTVMDGRELVTLDEEKVVEEAEKQAWRLVEGSGHMNRYPEFLKRGKMSYMN
jgi:5-methylthioadenosine/S-adenosylhomocysteine deaminase